MKLSYSSQHVVGEGGSGGILIKANHISNREYTQLKAQDRTLEVLWVEYLRGFAHASSHFEFYQFQSPPKPD